MCVEGKQTDQLMAIPTFQEMFRPILELAQKQDLTRRAATDAMSKTFGLTPEEASRRIPSGAATYVGNRTGWAMTFLTKGRLIEKSARHTYRLTDAGRRFLAEHPGRIATKDLKAIDGWEEAWKPKRVTEDGSESKEDLQESESPLEAIDRAVASLHDNVRRQVLDAILEQSPEFFEQLVLDVLVRMGYGGSREDAAVRLGRSGDEGIDGVVNQDALGLDQIMVQAKRYKPDNLVDRKSIQAFIGSLAGQGVVKGIFITTSHFQDSAKEFVQRGANTKVVLIDGQGLVDLMLRHRVGVRVQRTIDVMDLDQNYFEDDE